MRAWLVTWEYSGRKNEIKNRVVAILNFRYSPDRVCNLVEQLYISHDSTISEHIAYAKNKKNNPYPAYYNSSQCGRHTWQINCGHNPYLYARLVENLKLEITRTGKQILTWTELLGPGRGKMDFSLEQDTT